MKHVKLIPFKKMLSKVILSVLAFFYSLSILAQDKKVEVDINTKSEDSNFFMQPWVWIVGGAIFILLLVALLRSNRSKD